MKIKDALAGVVAAVLVTAASAGSASAVEHTIHQYSFHGTFAEAVWSTSSATSSTGTDVTASRTQQGRGLFVYQFTSTSDQDGNFSGAVYTIAAVTGGFSLSINPSL